MADASGAEKAFRWLFEDRTTGRIVIGQTPNLALSVFAGAVAVDLLLRPGGPAGAALRVVKVASLSAWALDELLRGVNPFRRMGGAVALLAVPFVALR